MQNKLKLPLNVVGRCRNPLLVAIFKNDFYKEFKNDVEACKYLGVHKGSVGRVAKGKVKTIKGYKAKYI